MSIKNRFFAVLVAVIVAGCGGGSDGSSSTGDTTDGTSDGTATAYQIAYRACESGTQTTYLFVYDGNGKGTRTVSQFDATDCSGTATSTITKDFTFVWVSYDVELSLKELNLTEDGVTLYTIVRWNGRTSFQGYETMIFGAPPPISSEGMDGTTAEKRYDQLSDVYYIEVR
jgi:hypothetical protein